QSLLSLSTDTATPETSTLSLHDALPICSQHQALAVFFAYIVTCCLWTPMTPLTDAYALRGVARYGLKYGPLRLWGSAAFVAGARSEEHTSELQSLRHLVCRLLLEKKKTK